MFFRRERAKVPAFQERLDTLIAAGFSVAPQPSGMVRVTRGECAVDLREEKGDLHINDRAGILIGNDIGVLVDGGYQKFFRTAAGVRVPAQAEQLKALHDFEADLHEKFGETLLYNEALGTVSTLYQYDRVKDRDRGVPKRAWE